MASEIVSGSVESILGLLTSLVAEEIVLVWGVRDDLEELKQRLEKSKAEILDAEQTPIKLHEVKVWLTRIQQFCYDTEDVMDEFQAEAERRHGILEHGNFLSKFGYNVSCIQRLRFRHKMAYKIQNLKERFDSLVEDKKLFPISASHDHRTIVSRRESHSYVSVPSVFGRKEDKQRIIELLMSPSEAKISVIPIVGIGGIGKTTLARMVFADKRVTEHFEIMPWVSLQEEFNVKTILKSIVEELGPPDTKYDHWNMNKLQGKLRSSLENKRCLLVLDDVWNVNRNEWMDLKHLLESVSEGSRIIVTSRNKRDCTVMSTMRAPYYYDLRPISVEDSVNLFMKCAFEQGEEKSHPDLARIGKEIVKKCAGNPLAVKALGSLLYAKHEERDWVHVRDSELWKLQEPEILPSLRISYDLMPIYLKRCFAFCSIFPKNYQFNDMELIQLWMANGLIESRGSNEEFEDIGKRYWEELWSRSFFEDVQEDTLFLTFSMHDLIHQLCLSVAQHESSVVDVGTDDVSNIERIRHLSLADPDLLSDKLPENLSKLKGLHTLMFPIKKEGPAGEAFLRNCISRFKHLRVLYLHDSTFEELPSSVKKLRLLRFLHLCGNPNISRLPDSVCELRNLQSLGLAKCESLEELPTDLNRMINLRFLDITTKQAALPEKEIGSLAYLRALFIGDCHNLVSLFQDIGSLTQLRKLFIGSCPMLKSLPRGIQDLERLQDLWIGNCELLKLSEIEEDAYQQGNRIPSIRLNLRSLVLFRLPKLVSLPEWLKGSATTLRRVIIDDCPNFRYLPEWLHQCSSLQKLKIEGCPEVSRPQGGFPHLASLKILTIEDSTDLSKAFQKGGEDWSRIAHIPEIHVDGERIK